MRLLVVTPIHNEVDNIGVLATQLEASSVKPDLWIVVDDGSDDDGVSILRRVALSFDVSIVARENRGGLIGGSAFTAWQSGVDSIGADISEFDAIMKLDADVDLPTDYLAAALQAMSRNLNIGVAGGSLRSLRSREQSLHIPGPVKLYSKRGYRALDVLPRRVGFDVMDELAIKSAGLDTVVIAGLKFDVRREIGASQGLVHGRRRNGRVCRWTGYWTPYFLLHACRYSLRRPYVSGALAMILGYLTAGRGPYPTELKRAHAAEQRAKLRALARNPVRWMRETYA